MSYILLIPSKKLFLLSELYSYVRATLFLRAIPFLPVLSLSQSYPLPPGAIPPSKLSPSS